MDDCLPLRGNSQRSAQGLKGPGRRKGRCGDGIACCQRWSWPREGSLRQNEEPATGASWSNWGAALTAGKVTQPGLSQQIFPVADPPEVRPVCHQIRKVTQLNPPVEYMLLREKFAVSKISHKNSLLIMHTPFHLRKRNQGCPLFSWSLLLHLVFYMCDCKFLVHKLRY